ncbi:hypothetical protein CLOSTASPAR_01075 [[Clostridium] asparagiforme DSM 15981]|uniref:Uncharacterized protein n=1 Tax=[Clostridium] asparagiforme DSM 15981 TaxID=518636 RepID=C0CVS3_9FIRM|nr:hypothetical protein CLOSTASPAR_01075 [[Clostridium] asparagiforme DSM 15981]
MVCIPPVMFLRHQSCVPFWSYCLYILWIAPTLPQFSPHM